MTTKEEKLVFENNDLHIKLERIHSLAAALESMLEDEPRMSTTSQRWPGSLNQKAKYKTK